MKIPDRDKTIKVDEQHGWCRNGVKWKSKFLEGEIARARVEGKQILQPMHLNNKKDTAISRAGL